MLITRYNVSNVAFSANYHTCMYVYRQDKYEDAVKLYRRAIVYGVRCIGPAHEKVALWRIQLANVLVRQASMIIW